MIGENIIEEELPDFNEEEDEEVYVTFDIATYPSDFTLAGIVKMWDDANILIPDFQREFVWNIKQASLLIESFLLGLPVPPVFFYIDEENSNLVIDGQQRILSTVYFFHGFFGPETQGKRQVFRLQGLNKKSPYVKKTFNELEDSDKRKLNNTVLRAINIRQLSPSGESTSMYHIFERLNTGGTPLKSQEIRNVVFRGKLVEVLKNLNKDKNWRTIIGIKNSNKHQRDVELVLRMLAFSGGLANYERPVKEFLNKTMKKNQSGDTKLVQSFKEKFANTTELIVRILGEKPFHLRGRLNYAAMDSIFPLLMNNFENIKQNELEVRFKNLIEDQEFKHKTNISTSDEAVVKSRHKLVQEILMS